MNTTRISIAGGTGAIVTAALIDLSEGVLNIYIIGLLVDTIIGIFAMFGFGIYFSHKDMSLLSHERALASIGTAVGELTPVVNMLPFWTGLVAYTVITEWMSTPIV